GFAGNVGDDVERSEPRPVRGGLGIRDADDRRGSARLNPDRADAFADVELASLDRFLRDELDVDVTIGAKHFEDERLTRALCDDAPQLGSRSRLLRAHRAYH